MYWLSTKMIIIHKPTYELNFKSGLDYNSQLITVSRDDAAGL